MYSGTGLTTSFISRHFKGMNLLMNYMTGGKTEMFSDADITLKTQTTKPKTVA